MIVSSDGADTSGLCAAAAIMSVVIPCDTSRPYRLHDLCIVNSSEVESRVVCVMGRIFPSVTSVVAEFEAACLARHLFSSGETVPGSHGMPLCGDLLSFAECHVRSFIIDR